MPSTDSEQPLHVIVAGAGVAALETVLALRAIAAGRVHVAVVAPEPDFVYRPLSTQEPFGLGDAIRRPLAEIAGQLGFDLIADSLDWVLPPFRRIFLRSGRELSYDALVVAVGARRYSAWHHGVVTFRGPEDVGTIAGMLREIERGIIWRVAFVVPHGVAWTLPIYELALNTAAHARAVGADCELALVTPEEAPLAIFGDEASATVRGLLEAAGVTLHVISHGDVRSVGEVEILEGGARIACDRIVALPLVEGPAIHAVPSDDRGFIPVDAHGVVQGTAQIYAAGDCVSGTVKQGGLAAQQGDAVAEAIAARAGAPIDPRPYRPVLRGLLLADRKRRFFRNEPDGGQAAFAEAAKGPLWWPASKVAGNYLAPYLEMEAEPSQEGRDRQVDVVLLERVPRPVGTDR